LNRTWETFEKLWYPKLLPQTNRQVFGGKSTIFGKTLPPKPAKHKTRIVLSI
jgi:hypothetical protein